MSTFPERSSSGWRRRRGIGRKALFLLIDATILALSVYLAFLLRFDGYIPSRYLSMFLWTLPITLGVKIPVLVLFRMYRFSWAYVGMEELLNTALASAIGSLALAAILLLLRHWPAVAGLPRSVLAIDFAFTLIGIGGIRLSKRIATHAALRTRDSLYAQGRPTLIVGAGEAGELLLRGILREKSTGFRPVALVDDDPAKKGLLIHGVPVFGPIERLPELIRSKHVGTVIIAMPSAPSRAIRKAVEFARKGGAQEVKIIPFFSELYTGELKVSEIRHVQPEDLLGREPVSIDTRALERFLRGKTVLVTGAAGSVGAELCRQILRFGSKHVFALDIDETGLFNLEKDLQRRFSASTVQILVGDVRDGLKMTAVLQHHRPQVVFHAAAYKHVPIMEAHPEEAVKTNVFGTQVVVEEACRAGAEAFVFISTDKAINPTSVMGATKRVAEMVVLDKGKESATRLMAVRFGNVLGSRGSALPLFMEQIKRGGPVTVTHPEMQRYFMTTAEAVLLVLQAAAMGQGGEVFVLDMGKPVRILDLAKELIRFHGLEPDQDIPIVFSGIRPGEKLYEELLTAEEGTDATSHKRVFVARMGTILGGEQTNLLLERLRRSAEDFDGESIVSCLQQLVPTYRSFKDAHSEPEIEGHVCN